MRQTLIAIALILAALIGGAAYWLSGNMGSLVRDAIEKFGGEMAGATVRVEQVDIKLADGQGALSGLSIGNPPGFKTAYALKVERIEFAADPASVTKDVIVVKKIAVIAPEIIYEKGDAMTNFDALQKNIAAYLGSSNQEEGGKKLIVEQFTMRNAKTEASAAFLGGKTVAVRLPDIVLHNIGKSRGGVTPGELGQEIIGAVKRKLANTVRFDRLMKSTGNTLEKAGAAVKGLFK